MRLLYFDRDELCITRDLSDDLPPYAILSHTWGKDEDEIKLNEIGDPDKNKLGYKKIRSCGEQAKRDGLDYFWVDSCCIDKTSTADLTKNINSMFRYYRESKKCYVYLSDVNSAEYFEKSRWFTRGWTLQELLAPACVEFYSSQWEFLGTKSRLEDRIYTATRVPIHALCGNLSQFSTDERMQWTTNRQTREKEDKAYCLLGIFDVSMNLRYGEGEDHAFARLENKIKKKSKFDVQSLDTFVRTYYGSGGRLDIERLSGQFLPMERCFINLGIVDKRDSERINTSLDAISSTLTARLQIETPDQAKQVTLQTLFDPRKLAHGKTGQPKRILIWGRAGIGKTTLCKKIVHDFYYNGLWHDLYSRVIWLPLRRLRLVRDENKTLAEMIQEVCFRGAKDDSLSSEQFGSLLNDRCLFILDGLDEVSTTFDPESPMGANLNKLLSQQNVIITSRPHSTNILNQMPPDLELETVGFFPAQVIEYLHKETDLSQGAVQEIQKFINLHPVMQSLVRIPIQLDAICYVWSTGNFQKVDMTMTALYRAISDCLWKKDIVRLDIKFEGQSITPQQVQFHTNIRFMAEREASCLELLAFVGLHNQLTEFNSQHISTITEHQVPLLIDRLCKSSFLRSSDTLKSAHQTYHFIHLTFQEFFAARYFVDQFLSGSPLKMFRVISGGSQALQSIEEIPSVRFIEKEKYNVRFDVFWRFVTGILQSLGDNRLHQFFDRLESEPVDLLGPVHQRLIIHCLKELDTTTGVFKYKARELEQQYNEWTQFELRLCKTQSLLAVGECPNWISANWLLGNDAERMSLMKDVKDKSNIPLGLLNVVVLLARDTKDAALRDLALAVIAKHCDSLSEKVFLDIFNRHDKRLWLNVVGQGFPFRKNGRLFNIYITPLLEEDDVYIQGLTLAALEYQDDLPEFAIQIVTELFQTPNQVPEILVQAACILERQNRLSATDNKIIIELMQDRHQDSNARIGAVILLERQSSLPDTNVEMIFDLFRDKFGDSKARLWAITILNGQKKLPETIIETLLQLLEEKGSDSWVRLRAAEILKQQDMLADSAFEIIVGIFQNEHEPSPLNRTFAAEFLEKQQKLPDTVIEALIRVIKDQESNFTIWHRAAAILEEQNRLPEATIDTFIKVLLDRKIDYEMRYRAALFLEKQGRLPESGVEAIVELLQNRDEHTNIRYRAVVFLERQNRLPESAIEVVVQLVQDVKQSSHVRTFGADIARRLPSLSKSHVQTFIKMLNSDELAMDAAKLLRSRAEFYPLITTLNYTALENLMRFWLRESLEHGRHNLMVLRGGILFIETGGTQWTIPFKKGEQETFIRRWLRARKELGTPLTNQEREASSSLMSLMGGRLRLGR